jgi:hypothetical protein
MVTAEAPPRFGPRLVHVGFVVDKVALVGQVSLRVHQFSFVRVTSSMIPRHIFHHQPYANFQLAASLVKTLACLSPSRSITFMCVMKTIVYRSEISVFFQKTNVDC